LARATLTRTVATIGITRRKAENAHKLLTECDRDQAAIGAIVASTNATLDALSHCPDPFTRQVVNSIVADLGNSRPKH
jgi:hypothetical protein